MAAGQGKKDTALYGNTLPTHHVHLRHLKKAYLLHPGRHFVILIPRTYPFSPTHRAYCTHAGALWPPLWLALSACTLELTH